MADTARFGRVSTLHSRVLTAALVVALGAVCLRAACADPISDFYDKKRITISVGGTSGGGYAIYARAIATFLGDHIPGNPTVIVQYMPGASTIRAANYIYNAAKKDGTEIGAFQQPVLTMPLYENSGIQYESEKFFWLGSINSDTSVCYVRADAGITTLKEAMQKEIIIGANAPSANSTTAPLVLNNLLHTRFKIISGYNGPDLALAIERNEVQGQCSSWSSIKTLRGEWLKAKTINILVQLATTKDPELPDVPLMMDFVTSEQERAALAFIFAPQQLGRPYALPPQVPMERVTAMRKALADTVTDPKLLELFDKQHLEISFIDGARMQNMVADLFRTPKASIDLAIKATANEAAASKN